MKWLIKLWRENKRWSAGLSLVELVVFIGVGSIMIFAIVAYVGRTFTLSREQLEQGAITEQARTQVERMSDEIRNAQYIDCNIDGDTQDVGEQWLQAGEVLGITVYSNVDDDVEAERVRYFVEAGVSGEERKLKRGVTQKGVGLCDFSGSEKIRTVMDDLRNVDPDPDVPLFRYYTSGDDAAEIAVPVSTLSSVLRVRLEMHVEESDVVKPDAVELVTDVVPRSIANPPACWDPGVQIFRYNYTHATVGFADTAFNDCQSHCATDPDIPVGECCAWSASFLWEGNPNYYVWSSCLCEDTYLPPDLAPEVVSVGQYTDYAKQCLEGSKCSGQKGEVICEAGCLDAPGQCVCVCPGGFGVTAACDDGFDNDNDGTADCATCVGAPPMSADPGCSDANDDSELGVIQCDDGIDNDSDSYIDFKLSGNFDPSCTDPLDNDEWPVDVLCSPTETPGVPQCNDGFDNDCDGLTDLPQEVVDCADANDNNEWSSSPQCSDLFDNDGDSLTDWPNDPECSDANDTSELIGATECSDGIDNDGDTFIDFPADPQCLDTTDITEALVPSAECNDGFDNDGDLQVDFPSDPECSDIFDDDEAA